MTAGTGPFGRRPAGVFNFTYDVPENVLYLEDSPRRVRVVVAGETVAGSDRVKLLHETGHMPVYYFPEEDVRRKLLAPSDHVTHCPYKGDAAYWSVQVGEDVREDAVWSYPDPLPGAPPLAWYFAFDWSAVDEWWEEAERIGVHPRDPYHRCDVVRADRDVVVRAGGRVVAESTRPTMLFETGLPPRLYLPEEDVDLHVLERTDTETSCPYKGTTSRYYRVAVDGSEHPDVAWVYDDPHAEVAGIAGMVAFYHDKIEVEVDGELWSRAREPRARKPRHIDAEDSATAVAADCRAAGVAMAYKLLDAAQTRWRRLNGHELVALIRAGATFVDGHLQERGHTDAHAA